MQWHNATIWCNTADSTSSYQSSILDQIHRFDVGYRRLWHFRFEVDSPTLRSKEKHCSDSVHTSVNDVITSTRRVRFEVQTSVNDFIISTRRVRFEVQTSVNDVITSTRRVRFEVQTSVNDVITSTRRVRFEVHTSVNDVITSTRRVRVEVQTSVNDVITSTRRVRFEVQTSVNDVITSTRRVRFEAQTSVNDVITSTRRVRFEVRVTVLPIVARPLHSCLPVRPISIRSMSPVPCIASSSDSVFIANTVAMSVDAVSYERLTSRRLSAEIGPEVIALVSTTQVNDFLRLIASVSFSNYH